MEDIRTLPEFNNNDIHYNIFRYLDKKWGLLNKKLRNLWLEKEGIAAHYNHVDDVIEKDYLFKNVTDLHLKYAGKIEIEELTEMTRLRRIFIYNLRSASITCIKRIKDFIVFLTSVENNRRKYPDFIGVFLDSNSHTMDRNTVLPKYYISGLISALENFSDLSNWMYISTSIYRRRIYTNIDQLKKLHSILDRCYYDKYNPTKLKKYQFISLKSKYDKKLIVPQECEAALVYYGQITSILDYFRENKDLIKPLKIMITEDRETLNHFSQFLKPQCDLLGVSTELVIIGEIHNTENIQEKESTLSTFLRDTYFSDFDSVNTKDKIYEHTSNCDEINTKIDSDIDLSEYFARAIIHEDPRFPRHKKL